MSKKAMILAAGKGERLRPLTSTIPKPMIDVCGKPIMGHLIELLHAYDYEVMANVHYLPDSIVDYFGDKVIFSHERELLGSAGAIKKVGKWLGEDFVVMNGDTLTNIDLHDMMGSHKKGGCIATIFTKNTTTHNGGTIIFNKKILDYIPSRKPYTVQFDLLPDLARRKVSVNLYRSNAYYFDIANIERLEKARRYYEKMAY